MLYAHWVKKEMAGQKQALYRYQKLKAPTPTLHIQYINSPRKGKLSSFSMREAKKLCFFSPYLKLLIFHISFSLLPYTELTEGPGNKMVYEAVAQNTALSITLVRKKKAETEPEHFYIPYTIYGEQSLKCTLWLLRQCYPGLSEILSNEGLSSENMLHFFNRQ